MKMYKKIVMVLLSAILLTLGLPSKSVLAANFTWSIGSDVMASQFNTLDMDPAIIKDGSDLYVIYGYGGVDDGHWKRFKGTTMDNLVAQAEPIRDSSFNRPNGDDKYWISAAWVDTATGKWYATVHTEFHYGQGGSGGFNWFRRIGLATSTDKGANWHWEGDIITSDNPVDTGASFAGNFYDFGCGDEKLYIDATGGYFYVWYMHAWVNKTTGDRVQSMRVARCAISDKMASGKWQKFYNGSWSGAGIGGHDSDVGFINCDSISVFYNTYLSKFVSLGTDPSGACISTCTDLSQQNWSPKEKLCDMNPSWGWYNFPVNPSDWNRYSTGQSFRVYSSRCNSSGFTTRYKTLTFGSGSTSPVTAAITYPSESVNDFNPNWDLRYGTLKNDDAAGMSYNGTWSYGNGRGIRDYNDDVHYTTNNSDYFQYTFTGTGIDYITEKNTSQGDVDVYIDGAFQQTVSTYNSASLVQQKVYSKTGLSSGTHTIKLVKKSGNFMVIDAVCIYTDLSTMVNDTSSISYSGTWSYGNNRGVGDYNDDVHYSLNNNDYFQYSFTGTGIDYITEKNSDQGNVDIYIDGVFKQTVSCYNSTRLMQQAVYSIKTLTKGNHTLKGVKTNGSFLVIDALKIYD